MVAKFRDTPFNHNNLPNYTFCSSGIYFFILHKLLFRMYLINDVAFIISELNSFQIILFSATGNLMA
jgi:hypothetical protein